MSEQNQAFVYATFPDLAGKRVVITGGGSGIGAELTTAFAGQGARVYFLDIAEEASRALEAQLAGARIAPTSC
jgi:NAD(P)-dependent dehydrogenase (short-subunit alcohol dehydrogenase family)